MVLMAIDHARDYFTGVVNIDPTDPLHSWPALFATRWITHLCAPGFIALAGTSVYLQRQRGKPRGQVTRLLLTRGLWLVFLEVTLISFGWFFSFALGLQVIWAIGVSMIFLGLLQRLSPLSIGVIGAVIVVGHNLLDGFHLRGKSAEAVLWNMVHQTGPLFIQGHIVGMVLYPILPWIGVICLGYAFGPIVALTPARRQRIALLMGVAMLTVFSLLRGLDAYGDPERFHLLATKTETAMSFFDVTKYPPSLEYLLSTLGVLLLLYAEIDWAAARDWVGPLRRFFEIYGRVPFFYYVLHIYLLHAAALLITADRGMNWRFWTIPGAVFIMHLDGWGYGLPGVYLAWISVVLVLYFPCRWFGHVKARRRDWWLSYL